MDRTRRPIIAGNWKMNAGSADGCDLAIEVAKAVRQLRCRDYVEVVIAPPVTALAAVAHKLRESKSTVRLAAQNMHQKDSGAFTGEVSAPMLLSAGAEWVILGHSERRHIFGESDESISEKVAAAMKARLRPILCVGETLSQREAGQTLEVVEHQVRAAVAHLAEEPGYGVVAYEPVWAIGTGKVAAPEDAQEVHAHIRAVLDGVAEGLGGATCILYGGSVKASNTAGLLEQPDLDGALVGGASLEAEGFAGIVRAALELAQGGEADHTAAPPEPDAAESDDEGDEPSEAGVDGEPGDSETDTDSEY